MKTEEKTPELVPLALVDPEPWRNPSRCKRPPLKPAPSLISRLLAFLGVK